MNIARRPEPLSGGRPFSLENLREVFAACREHELSLVAKCREDFGDSL
ncbi:hypothetical protein [Corynebacterium xerosis]|nr:hypothetical protein [Corynebacterium xerosis]